MRKIADPLHTKLLTFEKKLADQHKTKEMGIVRRVTVLTENARLTQEETDEILRLFEEQFDGKITDHKIVIKMTTMIRLISLERRFNLLHHA